MKKTLLLIAVAAMSFGSCGDSTTDKPADKQEIEQIEKETVEMEKATSDIEESSEEVDQLLEEL